MKFTRIRISRFILAFLWLGEAVIAVIGPFGMDGSRKTPMDYLFFVLVFVHFLWWLLFFRKNRKTLFRVLFRMPEVLFALTLMLFLFSYIYASNANMDYVQRFAASSGNLRLAPDSTVERLNSLLRYLPLLLFQLYIIIYYRIKKRTIFHKYTGTASFFTTWGLLLSLLSAVCYTAALPSFIRLDGVPILAWVCMVPLFVTIQSCSRLWGTVYGVFFGVIQTMLCNYWLGTFSLISLQFITVYYLILYIVFMTALVNLVKNAGMLSALAIPAAWTAFDFLRSLGFMGYPWAMLGVSQYQVTPLIQLASVTGVWGISFLVYASNAVFTRLVLSGPGQNRREGLRLTGVFISAVFLVYLSGQVYLFFTPSAEQSATVALIQQNTDPRKDDYEEGLAVLQRLTDRALARNPDLVAWSETAFVPNIRRWSQVDPERNYYAGLVDRFLRYQRSLGTWLVTGNDDYFLLTNDEGEEIRHDYNASILFSPAGERVETYHKIHLVPFTEYFPFKEQLPWMYELLINFDVHLWTPGETPTVFEHPDFTFSTPICFEDSFPGDVRRFVREGADVIINLSNDFWSLTNVEAKQHYVNALFRAVENRRHFLRATASGVTAHIDPRGRTLQSLPYYEEGFLLTEVPLFEQKHSVYTRAGDWFPYLCIAVIGLLLLYRFFVLVMKKEG
jgi:apolipoprotein N-acyltransferase